MAKERSYHDPAAGSEDLERMVARFQRPLRSYFRKRIGDAQESEDLVQEVFVRMTQQRHSQRIGNSEAYIFQIAANLLRDRARRSSSKATALDELSGQLGETFEELSPERVLLGRQRLANVHSALMELPERTRVIFVLHRFEEVKYSQIAHRLGISVSSVEKHMMDAIRHITVRVVRE